MPDYTSAKEAQAYLRRALQTKHRRVISRAICTLSEAGWEMCLNPVELDFVKPRGVLHYRSGIVSIQQYEGDRNYEESGFVTIIHPIEQAIG